MSQREGQTNDLAIKPGPHFNKERCQEIREELRQLIAAGEHDLRLDLHDTVELSPSAIYLLLATRHTLEAAGAGRLVLLNLNDDLRQLLTSLHLDGRLGLNG